MDYYRAVSYTHLDVYKRQITDPANDAMTDGNSRLVVPGLESKNIDVYKRQDGEKMNLELAYTFDTAAAEAVSYTHLTIPSMLPFYRQGQALAGIAKQPFGISRERICHALFAAGIMACFGISLNNLISMTKLTEISMGYQQANTDFYGSTIGMEILCLAVFTPILEELVFRGILFGRLKDMLSKPFAVGISALIFAAVHANIEMCIRDRRYSLWMSLYPTWMQNFVYR